VILCRQGFEQFVLRRHLEERPKVGVEVEPLPDVLLNSAHQCRFPGRDHVDTNTLASQVAHRKEHTVTAGPDHLDKGVAFEDVEELLRGAAQIANAMAKVECFGYRYDEIH